GANATIVCGITVGEYAMIGAGSVVAKDVPPFALMIGNPAWLLGYVCYCGNRLIEDAAQSSFKCSVCGKSVNIKKGQTMALNEEGK
ncbi:MAG: hypothetical protein PHQ34_04555, partial [Methanothrix sp.]|nr:hypothetical protein [Methanothrix sp.]